MLLSGARESPDGEGWPPCQNIPRARSPGTARARPVDNATAARSPVARHGQSPPPATHTAPPSPLPGQSPATLTAPLRPAPLPVPPPAGARPRPPPRPHPRPPPRPAKPNAGPGPSRWRVRPGAPRGTQRSAPHKTPLRGHDAHHGPPTTGRTARVPDTTGSPTTRPTPQRLRAGRTPHHGSGREAPPHGGVPDTTKVPHLRVRDLCPSSVRSPDPPSGATARSPRDGPEPNRRRTSGEGSVHLRAQGRRDGRDALSAAGEAQTVGRGRGDAHGRSHDL